MIRRENIIKRFTMGISVLTAYIHYMGSLNMHDINISSEQFICDLLNILYNIDLKNANNNSFNNVGEYSCAAEPPVRGGVSHLSRRNEPL